MTRVGFACASLVLLMSPMAQAEVDKDLSTLFSRCWDAVDGGGLEALAPYDVAFNTLEEFPKVTNEVWAGLAATPKGNIEVSARVRDGVLFDCTLVTFPESDVSEPLSYEAAKDTIGVWFGAKYAQDGFFDTFPEYRIHATVRCAPPSPTIAASASTMAPVVDEIQKGATGPIPGALRFAVHQTSPKNFEFFG